MESMHGLALLRRLKLFEPPDGMWANLGMRITRAEESSVVIEGSFSRQTHGRAGEIHRGAVAAIADGATACAAATLAAEGEIATTVELILDFFRPARPGRALAKGSALHRAGHLVFCAATVEQRGETVAEAHATIALVRPA
ncbi:MAG TPA: PaaI family thioesterase [Candidatus Dormibacteraeota bacterium]|nr:PaaI family thioesterase [Candidatus Dormibacteraeota bacterium]